MAAQLQALKPHVIVFLREMGIGRTTKKFPFSLLSPLSGRIPFHVASNRPSLKSLDPVGKEELESHGRLKAGIMYL